MKITKNTTLYEVGFFPELQEQFRADFPAGKIVLKHGEHKGPNRGFGITHILAEHTTDLSLHNLPHNNEGVANYVRLILRTGAKIFSEFSSVRGNHRPMVIWSMVGTVVLERKQIGNEVIYSVVTAFGRKNAVGVQIGIM